MTRLTFTDRREAFREGNDSPRDMLERCLARIGERDGAVHAFTFVNAEAAREAADAATARWREGKPASSIDGMPIALKDIFETADMPTTFGSPIFTGWRGGRDSAVAYALRAAGAVLIGKTVTTEFAATYPGPTCNPLDLKRTPGGSSSGSAAAVADGMVAVAMGSQVVGSVLRPASFCGVIGFKPSYGALNKGGVSDLYSQNCVGTLSNSLADAFAVCHEIALRVGGDPGHTPFRAGPEPELPRPPRALGVLQTGGWGVVEAEAKRQFLALLTRLIAEDIEVIDRRASAKVERLEQAIADARELSNRVNAWESLWPFAELESRHGDQFSPPFRKRILEAKAMTADDYLAALARRDAMRAALDDLADDVDALITLSAPGPAPVGLSSTGNPVFNAVATALRAPALSLPILEADAMPLGVQLIGFAGDEAALSAYAQWLIDVEAGHSGSHA